MREHKSQYLKNYLQFTNQIFLGETQSYSFGGNLKVYAQ